MSFVEQIEQFLATLVGIVWNTELAIFLVGTGLLLTIVNGIPQIKGFWHAIGVVRGKFDDPNDPGEISHFQALTTALSATVGLGNIAGVGVAIHMGGPGAVFWMVMVGLVGMATKYSECSLAVMYRHVDERGEVHGGPMHYIRWFADNLKGSAARFRPFFKFLAGFFAIACICSSFGAANMFQTNQVAAILNESFGVNKALVGATLAIMTAIVIIGGIKRIGQVTGFLVPFMGGIYVLGALAVIFYNFERVPEMFGQIFQGAFGDFAVAGGVTGIAVKTAIIQGVRRACFSNEAGLGSAAIAHSAAATKEPVREGVVALLEPFIDTVVICTMTALVILTAGPWWELSGVELTARAFNCAFIPADAVCDPNVKGFGFYFIPFAVFLFAYSTLLSWSYYGERAVDYLWPKNKKAQISYKTLFCVLAFVGAIWQLGPVLNFSDIMLGLMVVPNLIGVLFLLPRLRKETKSYFGRLKSGEIKPQS